MEISFAQLHQVSFNLTGISVVERTWSNQNINRHSEGRNFNILSLTLQGNKNFWTPDFTELIASNSAPTIALICQGTPYFSQTEVEDGGAGRTICVEFQLMDDDGHPILLTDRFFFWDSAESTLLIPQFRRIIEDYLQPTVDYITLKRDTFQLIQELALQISSQDTLSPKLQFLQPAIEYIRQNPDKKVAVTELARMCMVSESYFRASFNRFSGGISVTKYRNILRIKKAQELLGSSLWTTAMIAEQLGFYDVSHFYRVYKSITGELPKAREVDGFI